MDESLHIYLYSFLFIFLSLNLYLTFRLILKVRYLNLTTSSPQRLSVGTTTNEFDGRRVGDGKELFSKEYSTDAKVLVFLSSICDKCKGKLAEIEHVLSLIESSGVLLWLLTNESSDKMKKFLKTEVLCQSSIVIDDAAYEHLNPQGASPYYLFVDAENVLQAEGFIGDENWLSFVEQVSSQTETVK